ncbi:MAG: hypothetical protein GY852_07555, partial [bacterium]|nr:hypothetical protein [bacterium]
MKHSLIISVFLTAISIAAAGTFNWQSLGGEQGDNCSVAVLESDASHLLLEVVVPGFSLGRITAGETVWDCIELPGATFRGIVGDPEVPSISRMFALPYNSRAVISIENVQYTTYSGINLIPAQIAEIDMPHNPHPFTWNEAAYQIDCFAPDVWADAVNPGFWGGIQTGMLLVHPFRFNPATGELLAAKSLTVRIDFDGPFQEVAFPSTEAVQNSASRLLVNYGLVQEAVSSSRDSEAPEYIFVTTESNLDALLPLIELYQGTGYETSVQVFSVSATEDEIKTAILDNYDTGTTRFALLAGDYDALPSYDYGSFVGDYWYACIVGSDLLPEIAVGRLTGSAYRIETQVSKIIEGYYQYNFDEATSQEVIPATGVLAAHQQDYPELYTACCNEIAAEDYSVDMSFTKIYPPEGGTSAMLEDCFNNGTGSVGYRGHAYVLNWTWNPG